MKNYNQSNFKSSLLIVLISLLTENNLLLVQGHKEIFTAMIYWKEGQCLFLFIIILDLLEWM